MAYSEATTFPFERILTLRVPGWSSGKPFGLDLCVGRNREALLDEHETQVFALDNAYYPNR